MAKHDDVLRRNRILCSVAGLAPAVQCATLGGLGAATLWTPEAHAIPVQSSVTNLVIPASTSGLYINVVSGVSGTTPAAAPGWDINPWGSSTLSFFNTGAGSNMMYYPGVTTGSNVGSLDLGTVVGPSSAFATGITSAVFGASPGQWDFNATNYFGFRFTGDDALTHYGWGSMLVGASATTRTVGELWYESTPGAAITVGPAIAAVPEPATTALLATGVVGLLALRRRRVQAVRGV